MKSQSYWSENEEFHFPYQGQDFCVQVFNSIILRGYKCKILSMNSPFDVHETDLSESVFDAIGDALFIIDEKTTESS